ncbi:MAG: proliferating cell nuclear antigen (pcna) [archaeon]
MSFKATLTDVGLLRDSLAAISELVSEGIFQLKKDHIYFASTDPTMVTMVRFKMLSMVFDEYKLDDDEELSINIESLINVLKRAKSSDAVVFELEKDQNKLSVTLKNSSVRTFKIPLIDIEKSDVPDMKLDFSATVETKSSVLTESIGDASIITDTVVMSADAGSFSMTADGDLSQVNVRLTKDSPDVVGINVSGDAKSKYSLDYLKKIEKGSKIADTVKMQFGKDYPVRFTFINKDKAELSYVLAPRVED